jgi:uncharacterized protein (TIGR02996 family)
MIPVNDCESLLKTLLAEPGEDTAALVFADYLQENGAGRLARLLRLAVSYRPGVTVYLVSEGEYSGYSVCGVFSSEADAVRVMESCGGVVRFNDLEKFTLDEGAELASRGLKLFSVTMNGDGNEAKAELTTYIRESFYLSPSSYFPRHVSARIWAKDVTHALKIANEKRIAALAAESLGVPRE